ncbi:MAG: hypothetical protein U0931_40265 [Vulcanimicrobiota bacterium]
MSQVTDKQLRILAYLEEYRRLYHCSPVLRELCEHFGWVSPQASSNHLNSLTAKGCIIPIVAANGSNRGYRLSSRGRQLLRASQAS